MLNIGQIISSETYGLPILTERLSKVSQTIQWKYCVRLLTELYNTEIDCKKSKIQIKYLLDEPLQQGRAHIGIFLQYFLKQ